MERLNVFPYLSFKETRKILQMTEKGLPEVSYEGNLQMKEKELAHFEKLVDVSLSKSKDSTRTTIMSP